MEENNLIICPHCGYEYKSDKHEYCPNCNDGKENKHPIIRFSELSVTMPFGGKAAILLTSCYSIYRIFDALTHFILIDLVCVAMYLALIYFWFMKKDIVETPIWFLVLLTMIYAPVLILILMLVLR
jgi:hypothetical protein